MIKELLLTFMYKIGPIAIPFLKNPFTLFAITGAVTIAGASIILPYVESLKCLPILVAKQRAHQDLLEQFSQNQLRINYELVDRIESFKRLYIQNTDVIVEAFNNFSKRLENNLLNLSAQIDNLSRRLGIVSDGMASLMEKLRTLKASAEPKSLTFNNDDEDTDSGSSRFIKDPFPWFKSISKNSYIEEIYNALYKSPTTTIVNMFTDVELDKENDLIQKLRQPLEKDHLKIELAQEELKVVYELTKEEKAEVEKIARESTMSIQSENEKVIEKNKEVLNSDLFVEDCPKESRIIKRMPYWEQNPLFLGKNLISALTNSQIGLTFCSASLSFKASSFALTYISSKFFIDQANMPQDGSLISKVSGAFIFTGSVAVMGFCLMPTVSYGLKKTGERIKESLEKETLYEGGKTKEQVLEELLESGEAENVSFEDFNAFSNLLTLAKEYNNYMPVLVKGKDFIALGIRGNDNIIPNSSGLNNNLLLNNTPNNSSSLIQKVTEIIE